jgi:hypothetical protein
VIVCRISRLEGRQLNYVSINRSRVTPIAAVDNARATRADRGERLGPIAVCADLSISARVTDTADAPSRILSLNCLDKGALISTHEVRFEGDGAANAFVGYFRLPIIGTDLYERT